MQNRNSKESVDKMGLLRKQIIKSEKVAMHHDEHGKHDWAKLMRDKADMLTSEYIKEWKQYVISNNPDTVIISLGSANSKEQQCPSLCSNAGNTFVLNIDPSFIISSNSFSKNNVSVEYLPTKLDEKSQNSYDSLRKSIAEFNKNGTSVIFICSTYPHGHQHLNKLIKDNFSLLHHSFSYIGSYHDKNPVVVYSKEFFECAFKAKSKGGHKEVRILNGFAKTVWGQGKSYTQDELDVMVSENNFSSYGQFFNLLKSVTFGSLFPKKEKAQTHVLQQKPTLFQQPTLDNNGEDKKSNAPPYK